jgi:hypothetical protein
MTKSQLKQIIKECIKEIHDTNESFGVYQGQSTPLRSLYNKIKSDPIVKKNRINVNINDGEDIEPVYRSIDLTHNTFEDFSVQISSVGENKYEVEIPYYGKNQYDRTIGGSKTIVTDEKGVMRIIYYQIKQQIG